MNKEQSLEIDLVLHKINTYQYRPVAYIGPELSRLLYKQIEQMFPPKGKDDK